MCLKPAAEASRRQLAWTLALIAGAAPIACAAPITWCSSALYAPSVGRGLNIYICVTSLQCVQVFSPSVMFKHFKPAPGKGSVPAFLSRTYRSRRDTAFVEAGLCGSSWPGTPSTLF